MKNQYCEFEWNGILIALTYHPKKFGTIDHIEIETIDPPRAPLPITETGYRSHYCQIDELDSYERDPVRYMREALDHYAQSRSWQQQQDAARQYSLF